VREVLVDLDDDAHRIAWTIVDGPLHAPHRLGAGVLRGRRPHAIRWITDLLPDELAAPTAKRMEEGTRVVRETQEGLVTSA
jgi:hypothetical protein